ncbi:heterokaryon incompatibility protein-domain-containing protein [Geopyxis carbonaria]|nr:heterokaryon incompatibility protein-domain-containing protein [Geopyxis carbonaria]
MVRKWVRGCEADHELCRTGRGAGKAEPFSPTRLIEVVGASADDDDGLRLRLVEEFGCDLTAGRIRYLALSHCWGLSTSEQDWQLKTTTTVTLTQRKNGITMATLPPLYQDALRITHALGERYLWIDSLCILQDSADDWTRESSVMGRIYAHAFCTISADAASSSAASILTRRDLAASIASLESANYQPSYVGWGRNTPASSSATDYPEYHAWSDLVAAQPLSRRAWTLQERQLSRRIVHYTQHQILWECTTLYASEIFPEGLPRAPSVHERLQMQPVGPAALWYWFVGEFSKRSLTVAEDRLPALSGIASSLAAVARQDAYIAGLWKSDLLYGLCWEASADTAVVRRRLVGSAPSWSWAGITGPVEFALRKPAGAVTIETEAEILDVAVTPLSSFNTLGSLSRGVLKVRGLLRTGKWDNTDRDSRTGIGSRSERAILGQEGVISWEPEIFRIAYDVEDPSDRDGVVCCLQVYEGAGGLLYGLLLVPVDGNAETYRRVGLVLFKLKIVRQSGESERQSNIAVLEIV